MQLFATLLAGAASSHPQGSPERIFCQVFNEHTEVTRQPPLQAVTSLYCNAPSADVVTLAIHVSRIQSILVRTYTTTYNTPRAHSPHTPILNWRSIKTSNQQINWCGSLLWCATTADLFHQTWYGNRCRPEAKSSELDYSFYISTALEWDRQIAHILLTCLAVVMCLKNVSPLSLEFAQLHGIEFAELNKDEFHLTSRHESIRLQDDLQQLFKNKSCNCFNL